MNIYSFICTVARQKDDRKIDAIYKSALELVLKEGFSGFKMSQVAKSAGIATGTLYIYFKDKHHLINELYRSVKRESVKELMLNYDLSAPFLKSFEKMWYDYLEYSLEKPEEGVFVEQYFRSPYLNKEIIDETDQLMRPIFELIERGKKEKLVNDIPTELLVSQLIGGLNELSRWHHNGRLQLTARAKKLAFTMAMKSIKR